MIDANDIRKAREIIAEEIKSYTEQGMSELATCRYLANKYDCYWEALQKLAKQLEINFFNTKSVGLNKEVIEFSNNFKNYQSWMICHSDLPYVTKYFAKTIIQEIEGSEILIAKSKDSGTPFIAGTVRFDEFRFGVKSFDKHSKYLKENKYKYKQIFITEFTFEIDEESDYQKFLLNQPRWFKKLTM